MYICSFKSNTGTQWSLSHLFPPTLNTVISSSAVLVVWELECFKHPDSSIESCCSLHSFSTLHYQQDILTKLMRLGHTCSLHPRYRWLTTASPRQSSWQTEWDQWLLPGVQDFSPLPRFVPSHTGTNTQSQIIVLICNNNKMPNEPLEINTSNLICKVNLRDSN